MSTATVAVSRRRSTLVSDSWVIARRGLVHMRRQPEALSDATIQPIMFVLLFAYVFGGAIEGSLPRGVTYIDFLLPGIFIQAAAFRSTQTAVGLAEDLERGVVSLGSGDLVLLAAVGANVHYGAQLVRL
jgi:ABC-2 type transport system permease protein/oleandomycin transport system permease protein